MTDAPFREPDMVTRKVTAPPGTSLFYCSNCNSITVLAGKSWQCAGPKSGRRHDWTGMTYARSTTYGEAVDSNTLNLRRG
jgi:hypothetical protein